MKQILYQGMLRFLKTNLSSLWPCLTIRYHHRICHFSATGASPRCDFATTCLFTPGVPQLSRGCWVWDVHPLLARSFHPTCVDVPHVHRLLVVSGSISQTVNLNPMNFTPMTQSLSGHTGIWYTAPRDASPMNTSLFVVGPPYESSLSIASGMTKYTQPIIIVQRNKHIYIIIISYTVYIYINIYIYSYIPNSFSMSYPMSIPYFHILLPTSLPAADRSRWPRRWRLPTMPHHKCTRACTFAQPDRGAQM